MTDGRAIPGRRFLVIAAAALAVGALLALAFANGRPAAAGPIDEIDDLNLPIQVEESRDAPKRVTRGVQGQQGGGMAQQTSSTLISNTGQGMVGSTTMNNAQAQAFATGSNSWGYTLTSVEMRVHTGNTEFDYSVSIHTNSSGKPGTSLGTLETTVQSNSFALVQFDASGDGIDLAANSTYWVVASKNSAVTMRTTMENGESGAAGWSIRNTRLVNPPNWAVSNTGILMLAVNGYVNMPPALVSAEVNGTSLVLTFDKHLNTASRTAARQFGIKFGGGKLQNATRISIDGTKVTLTVPEVRAGQLVTVSYTVPTRNPLKGSNGLAVDAFANYTVTVNTGPAYGRLPESGKVRDAVYVTYTNANGEEETVENRAASADRETLWDYFYDSCNARRSLSNAAVVHDYSQYTDIVIGEDAEGNAITKRAMTQARNGWKWVRNENADGSLNVRNPTRPQTVTECANLAMYYRQAFCRNYTVGQLEPGNKQNICPEDRTW